MQKDLRHFFYLYRSKQKSKYCNYEKISCLSVPLLYAFLSSLC